ncbi:MAG: Putative N-acetylgalactosaminyl-diphosphoundecaprenol glucuronosyltransferase [uncultured Rubrobacteraceae bacterium]|uniref:N-acetylgalactosaminyl-diphosphoundecaprenol glucuronosyltransferase n=1 Tax=uncultured Rubrobacteraceae bacterium TaxID=349277 RepID=A0A6J4QVL3_9ACTN|nr:MAG: Putative N-acetylgalactosaminyl-diphosphoundecaprenol glucuronosyltransferase [uncultured Rubrobacteraceae bacterium]
MYRFWDTITGPVLEALRPESIVEIGSDYGPNTRRLLEFCRRHGARLHVIDPLPKYNVAAWQEQYGEHLIFHQAPSLDALPEIDRFDAVFIDGDHNWYTVFHELKLIEERCKALSQPFPLVMLHDVGWPYGRRDGYYDPDGIPDEYRNPYERKGMRPGSSDLVEEDGLNPNFPNATSENDPRNGVLTAVEDFLEQMKQEVEVMRVPGFHGLGILVPSRLKQQNAKLAEFLDVLDLPPIVARYVELVEEARVEAEIERQENKALAQENRRLKQQLQDIQSSRGWRLLTKLGLLRVRILGR